MNKLKNVMITGAAGGFGTVIIDDLLQRIIINGCNARCRWQEQAGGTFQNRPSSSFTFKCAYLGD